MAIRRGLPIERAALAWPLKRRHPCSVFIGHGTAQRSLTAQPAAEMATRLTEDLVKGRSGQFDLESVQWLDCAHMNVAVVEVIDKCTSLQDLKLGDNNVRHCVRVWYSCMCVCVCDCTRLLLHACRQRMLRVALEVCVVSYLSRVLCMAPADMRIRRTLDTRGATSNAPQIKTLSCIAGLPRLTSLDVSHNKLSTLGA